MRKKLDSLWEFPQKLRKVMSRLTIMLTLLTMCTVTAAASAQNVSINVKRGSLNQVFQQLTEQTEVQIVYNTEVARTTYLDDLDISDMVFEEALDIILRDTGLYYEVHNGIYLIKERRAQPTPAMTTVGGAVKDIFGKPMPGVTVVIKGTKIGVATDAQGNFSIRAPQQDGFTVVFSFVGMETQEVRYRGQIMNIVMREAVTSIDEVIVTGIYVRAKESFTGSATTYTATELKSVGNQNILQSLKTLDPAFAIIENNEFGSDPNTMPDIEVRGKTSIMGFAEEYGTNPNQPLFIVDNFESTLEYVMDMSMDMVESITILKDAASTAIWGSKAANGVIVIETRRPVMGKLKFSYTGNFNVNFPDLTDYNLMNAEEKLQYELLSGRLGALDENGNITSVANEAYYMKALKEVLSGVDTYWLHLPLRVGFTNKHTVFADGGANEIRYGMGLSYGNTQGVMIGSDRETVNGNLRLSYQMGKLLFQNILNIDNVVSERENVEFSRFGLMNPYLRKTNDDGEVIQSYNMLGSASYNMKSPLWDMELNSFNRTSEFKFTNNFEVEWRIMEELRVRGRFGISKSTGTRTIFISPYHTKYLSTEAEEKGSYYNMDSKTSYYTGDAAITYGKLLNDLHRVNAVLGFTFRQNNSSSESYTVTGFVDDEYPNPNAAAGYKAETTPTYSESTSRSASYYLNAGYAYDDRYLLDVNFRMDGSSIFGVDHHFTQTWSVGVAWNMHREAFMDGSQVNMLKLRASIGNPGNQNFNDYISERVYTYRSGNPNKFGTAMIIGVFGNKDLKWQKTLDHNVGFDLSLFRNRLRVNFDWYYKDTDPLLVYIGIPSSTGGNSKPYNLGTQITKGMNVNANYQLIVKQDLMWSVSVNARSVRSTYQNLGDSLEKYNESNRASNSMFRFYDGASPNDLWAVQSMGIDPGTGKEIFVKLDGTQTFNYDKADEVVVGNTESDVEGVFGSRIYYKGFSLSFNIRYRIGGQALMSALYDKVENVLSHSNSMGLWYNQDKRALTERWKNPGDDARYLGIKEQANAITSRFVMDNNVLSGESITFSYESRADWVKKMGASSLTFNAYMNDIFRISTIKNERGIEYPFARSVSFSIGLRF